jgi:hypothetical protein
MLAAVRVAPDRAELVFIGDHTGEVPKEALEKLPR